MKGEEQYIELARKLKRLADEGSGGEKYNAQRQLDRVMAKYGITIEMLDEQILQRVLFKQPRNMRQLMIQVALSVVGAKRYMAGSKSKKTILVIEVTKLEEAEIRSKFNFFSREYKTQLELFEMAFVQKNRLFPEDGSETDIDTLDAKEKEKLAKMLEIAKGITRADYLRQIK